LVPEGVIGRRGLFEVTREALFTLFTLVTGSFSFSFSLEEAEEELLSGRVAVACGCDWE
jgi:hypothetical protein